MRIDPETKAPTISVIIPTLNAGARFGELLTLLRNQTLEPIEIIVIDSASDDGTAELAAAQGAIVRSVARAEFDHGGTRNIAAGEATGEVLVFMTQDAMPANEYMLEQLAKPLMNNKKVSSSYARQIPYPDASPIEQIAREHNYPAESFVKSRSDLDRLGIKTFFCSNVCAAIKRDVFEQMGRFEAPVIFNEDLFMAARCILSGYQVAYAADAVVYHSHNYSASQQFRRYFDNGVSMRRNEWVAPYSAIGGAGGSLVKKQLLSLVRGRQLRWIPVLIAEAAAKLIGFKLGFHHRKLPASLCRKLSMHKLIWQKLESDNGSSAGTGLPG